MPHRGNLTYETTVADEELQMALFAQSEGLESVDLKSGPRALGCASKRFQVAVEQAQLVPEMRRRKGRVKRAADIALSQRALDPGERSHLWLDPDPRYGRCSRLA